MATTRESPATVAAPMYITIGPPCSGKTTWLRQHATNVQDISIDDQDGVYVPLDTALFLNATTTAATANADAAKQSDEILSRRIFGQTVQQRIAAKDQAELRAVVQRLSGVLSAVEFAATVQALHNKGGSPVGPALVQAVERRIDIDIDASPTPLHSTTDLFIRQCLFTPNGESHRTGIQRAIAALQAVATDTPVAWGNTNTRPTDYQQALQLAARQGRPVHFVVYHAGSSSNNNNNTNIATLDGKCWDLVVDDWRDLLDRSVNRLLETGRYVPASVIWDMHTKTLSFLQRVVGGCRQELSKGSNSSSTLQVSKLDLDCGLARASHFDMNQQRMVTERHRTSPAKRSRPDQRGRGPNQRQRYRDGPPRNGPPARPSDRGPPRRTSS